MLISLFIMNTRLSGARSDEITLQAQMCRIYHPLPKAADAENKIHQSNDTVDTSRVVPDPQIPFPWRQQKKSPERVETSDKIATSTHDLTEDHHFAVVQQ